MKFGYACVCVVVNEIKVELWCKVHG